MDSWLVLRRAIKDTVRFFGWNLRSLTVPVLGVIGTLVHINRFGWTTAQQEVDVMISYALIPIGGFAVLILLWNIFLTPFRMLIEDGGTKDAPESHVVNFEPWDKMSSYRMNDAACLWAGIEPTNHIGDGTPARGYLKMLENAWHNHEIKLRPLSQAKLGLRNVTFAYLDVPKDELKIYAKNKDLKPLFLFPEERGK